MKKKICISLCGSSETGSEGSILIGSSKGETVTIPRIIGIIINAAN